jgi:hypothetical protein
VLCRDGCPAPFCEKLLKLAQDMRSKTPLPGSSFGYNDRGNPDFMQGHRYQNNTFGMNGPSRQGFNSQQQQRQWGFNNYPGR